MVYWAVTHKSASSNELPSNILLLVEAPPVADANMPHAAWLAWCRSDKVLANSALEGERC